MSAVLRPPAMKYRANSTSLSNLGFSPQPWGPFLPADARLYTERKARPKTTLPHRPGLTQSHVPVMPPGTAEGCLSLMAAPSLAAFSHYAIIRSPLNVSVRSPMDNADFSSREFFLQFRGITSKRQCKLLLPVAT